ncbi:MAG: aldehyde dehydrogenase [Planctomycetota bacterium]|nr:MAG: aldehyde dehydrogenase [Planctomycetota bacterium]
MSPRVHKTYKLYIGGKFPRSESGRTLPLMVSEDDQVQICRSSGKDLRNAVEAARKAVPAWSRAEPMLRGQILYRISEMLWARREEFIGLLVKHAKLRRPSAEKELSLSCDRLLHYAGWCDKYGQVLASVNAVPGPYFSFSMPVATGVISLLPPERPGLLPLMSCLAPALVPGNSTVMLSSIECAPIAMSLAEVLGSSDVPAGVVNILSGSREELLAEFAKHRGIDGALLSAPGEGEAQLLGREASNSLQRVKVIDYQHRRQWANPNAQGLGWIEPFVEIKTAWHSMGR